MNSRRPEISSDTRATEVIPAVYRFIITTLEPFFAIGGSLTVLTNPEKYLDTLTRASVPYDRRTSFLYTELCGAWLMFAFIEAVVLRLVDSHRVWRLLCVGMLLSDIAYCHSCAEAVGGWSAWVHIQDWTKDDWVVFVTTAPPVLTRLLVVLGIGVQSTGKAGSFKVQ